MISSYSPSHSSNDISSEPMNTTIEIDDESRDSYTDPLLSPNEVKENVMSQLIRKRDNLLAALDSSDESLLSDSDSSPKKDTTSSLCSNRSTSKGFIESQKTVTIDSDNNHIINVEKAVDRITIHSYQGLPTEKDLLFNI